MLSAALSGRLDAEQKKQILSEDFGIAMTETMERSVSRMCNLSYGIRLEGRAEGITVGKAEGRAEGIAVGKAEGIAVGKMNNLYELAGKGLLTLDVAAREAGQTEEEFRNGLNDWLAQRTSE